MSRDLCIQMRTHATSWTSKVEAILTKHGLSDLWNLRHYLSPTEISSVRDRTVRKIISVWRVVWKDGVTSSPKTSFFCQYKVDADQTPWLNTLTSTKLRWAYCQLRCEAHALEIELGRHRRIDRQDRLCTNCDSHNVEDIFHFMCECSYYNDLRLKFFRTIIIDLNTFFILLASNDLHT